jgi:hypothetical protein
MEVQTDRLQTLFNQKCSAELKTEIVSFKCDLKIPLKENKKLSAQNSNCNTVGLDFQMYRYM